MGRFNAPEDYIAFLDSQELNQAAGDEEHSPEEYIALYAGMFYKTLDMVERDFGSTSSIYMWSVDNLVPFAEEWLELQSFPGSMIGIANLTYKMCRGALKMCRFRHRDKKDKYKTTMQMLDAMFKFSLYE